MMLSLPKCACTVHHPSDAMPQGQALDLSGELKRTGWDLVSSDGDMGLLYRKNGFPRRLIVTFDQLSAFNHARDRVSGDAVVFECEADHLHFATSETKWFQSEGVRRIVDHARLIREQYSEVILYGHSMGAYGALLFSDHLNATRVVSFAPQFSVDPRKVPFENRFAGYVQQIDFSNDDMATSLSRTAEIYVVYDPLTHIDNLHVKELERVRPIYPVKLPFSGHLPAQFLLEVGCLKQVVIGLLLQTGENKKNRQLIRSGRRCSHRYFLEIASGLARRRNFKAALRAANAAYVLNPNSTSVLETYHALLMCDADYYGLSHAMVRLVMHEQPNWTYYSGTLDMISRELRNLSENVVGRAEAPAENDLY